jgi:hypothetical protein
MIYLRFAIRPSEARNNNAGPKGLAEFMFAQDDPRECTRRAVEVLRNEGWRALSLSDAQEGFMLSDFAGVGDFEALYTGANETGMSYMLSTEELAEAS